MQEVSISLALFQDYKRLDLFIHAAKQIGNAQFVIAGACNEWEKYEK